MLQLANKYTGLDEYRKCLLIDIQSVPLKKKKIYSFLNPENLTIITSTSDFIVKINGVLGFRTIL